jgi:hypothetical protein
MPQKIHPWTTKNRPTAGRIGCFTKRRVRAIQDEPVQDEQHAKLAVFRELFRVIFISGGYSVNLGPLGPADEGESP